MSDPVSCAQFPPTRWSLLERLQGPEPEAREAMEELCAAYWCPLHCFARQWGKSPADAEDATQSFMMTALRRDLFSRAKKERGKLRTFLLHAFKQWMINEREKENAVVNGGGVEFVSRDELSTAERYFTQLSERETPETLFDRVWALVLLDRVLERLEKKWQASGKGELFETLRPFLDGGRNGDESYDEAGRRLNIPGSQLRVAAFRLRNSYREELVKEIRETVPPGDEENEFNFLIGAVGRK